MPYNPYYYPQQYQQNGYQQNGYQNGYQQQNAYQQNAYQQNNSQNQIVQSGFVLVQSEQEARAYPVAPGNSITFKDESQPYCYVKTMGFNQLDRPNFEKYRLVKEDIQPAEPETPKESIYATKEEFAALRAEFEALKAKKKKKVEDEDDE